ncbi:PGPGW domain-containing protein [Thalassotalea fusca]
MHKLPKFVRFSLGWFLVVVGAIFILLPGPAFLFLPLGLAILSIDDPRAKAWLRSSQRMMSRSARKLDRWLLKRKHR